MSSFRFDNVEIDLALRQVRIDGQVNETQPKVFDLLCYLVQHRDRILSKDDLQDAIWPDTIVTESSLARAVMKARRAIGDDHQTMITSVYGIGYRFVVTVEGDASSTPTTGPSRPRWHYLALVLLATGLGIGTYAVFEDRADKTRNERLNQLSELVTAKRYLDAYDSAQSLIAAGVTDARIQAIWSDVADSVTITTEPEGATVVVTEWIRPGESSREPRVLNLGATPLVDVQLGRATWLLDVSLEGYAAVESVLSSELTRQTINMNPAVNLSFVLLPEDQVPGDMVFVPGGEYELMNPDTPRQQVLELSDFFIDRYEVNNADFLDFVEQGGYQQGEFWPSQMTTRDGKPIEVGSLATVFTDRTGMSGPRGWVDRQPRSGQEDWPVANVSWYEARAYCRFRGKRLPSVFEWEKASRDGRATNFEGTVMPWGYSGSGQDARDHSNYLSQAPVITAEYRSGVSPFGAYGMAGNVSEWTANPSQEGRAAMGGSFRDPPYIFSEAAMHHPAVSIPTLGFRCARSRNPDMMDAAMLATLDWNLKVQTPEYEPVSRREYEEFLLFYQYDKTANEAEIIDVAETPDWTRYELRYDGPLQNDPVPAYLWIPKNAEPPYQTLVYVPDSGVFNDYSPIESVERTIGGNIRAGRAAFTVVMKGMIGREHKAGFDWPGRETIRYRQDMAQRATDLQLGVDYLLTRDDIDPEGLVYASFSWGAGSELPQAGIERRTSAIVLIGGGFDERLRPTRPETDPVNFAPYFDAPTLMVHGRHDEENQWLTRGLPLWNMLAEPKELALFEGAGHLPPAEQRTPAINAFLDKHVGPVTPRLPGQP